KRFISDYVESVLAHPEGSPERLENEAFTVTSSYGTNDVIFNEANTRALRDGYGGAPGFALDEDRLTVSVTFQTFDAYVNDSTVSNEAWWIWLIMMTVSTSRLSVRRNTRSSRGWLTSISLTSTRTLMTGKTSSVRSTSTRTRSAWTRLLRTCDRM